MGVFPSISDVIASSTANIGDLAGFLTLPVVALGFSITVVVAGTLMVKKWLNGSVRRVTGTGGRRGKKRR